MIQSLVFSPFELNGLDLKNRVIKSATYEGMSRDGLLTDDLIDWHGRIVDGGVAMTTLAYCAVNPEGATFHDQIIVNEQNEEAFTRFCDESHKRGGRASIQLAHCGFFKKDKVNGKSPISPSSQFNKLGVFTGLPLSKTMSLQDIENTIRAFANAARRVKTCGFDAIEIHSGHGYLLSQFLSPAFNQRNDEYGGSLEKRLNLPVEVVKAVRKSVGDAFTIIIKINLQDGMRGGTTLEDTRSIARAFEQAGADALVLSGGITSVNPFYLLRGDIPFRQMIEVEPKWLQRLAIMTFGSLIMKKIPFEPLYFLDMAAEIRKEVTIPLVYIGGVTSLSDMEKVLEKGFDLIELGRPLIHDPDFLQKIQSGEIEKTGCTYCNQCVPEIDRNGVQCVLR